MFCALCDQGELKQAPNHPVINHCVKLFLLGTKERPSNTAWSKNAKHSKLRESIKKRKAYVKTIYKSAVTSYLDSKILCFKKIVCALPSGEIWTVLVCLPSHLPCFIKVSPITDWRTNFCSARFFSSFLFLSSSAKSLATYSAQWRKYVLCSVKKLSL